MDVAFYLYISVFSELQHDAVFIKDEELAHNEKETGKQMEIRSDEHLLSKYKKYACDICLKRFRRKYILTEHRKEEHGRKRIDCPTCGKSFAYKQTLKRHNKRFHSLLQSEAFPYQCKICGKRFNVLKKIDDHLKTHDKPDIFKCNDCGKVYANSMALKRHSSRHSVARFQCKTCKRSYTTNEDLQKHVGIHTGEHWCDVCFKIFASKGTLTAHKKRHLNEHTYSCSICGQCFRCNVVRVGHELKCGRATALFENPTLAKYTCNDTKGHHARYLPKNQQTHNYRQITDCTEYNS